MDTNEKEYFEANILDGDKVEDCGKAMLSADSVLEYVQERVAQAESRVRAEKEELADALIDMYQQYCDDGHHFMSAGERASTVLEMQGYAGFDDAGRLLTPKE